MLHTISDNSSLVRLYSDLKKSWQSIMPQTLNKRINSHIKLNLDRRKEDKVCYITVQCWKGCGLKTHGLSLETGVRHRKLWSCLQSQTAWSWCRIFSLGSLQLIYYCHVHCHS